MAAGRDSIVTRTLVGHIGSVFRKQRANRKWDQAINSQGPPPGTHFL